MNFKQSDFKCFGCGIVKTSGWVFWFSTLFCSLARGCCTIRWISVKSWCHIMGLFKIQLFQEVHKNLGNLPHGFDIVYFSKRQFHEEYLANLCGLLRKAELYMTDTLRNYYMYVHATFLYQLHVLFRWYMHQPKKTTLSDTWMSVRTSTSSTFGDTIKGSSHYAWIPPMTPSSQAHLTKVFVSGISGNYTCALD